MAQRILKNNTGSPVTISDTGGVVPASGQLVINPVDYGIYEGSSDVVGYIGDLTLTVNDGTFDLSVNEGTRLIQGGFSRPISDGEDPTIKASVQSFGGIRNSIQANNAIYVPWSVMAGLRDNRDLPLSYFLNDNIYWIFASEGPLVYQTNIPFVSPTPSASDQEDFEDNYKTTIDTLKTPIGMKLVGENGLYAATVELIETVPHLRTSGVQAIESLKGKNLFADCWWYIGTQNDATILGNIGDKYILDIAAGDDATNYPAINIEYTLTAPDLAGTQDELAATIAAYYNADSVFKVLWRAQRITGSGCIYITARKPGDQYQRPNSLDFQVTTTGSAVASAAQDKIIRQNKLSVMTSDPSDPRYGQLGTQGSVTLTAGDVTNFFQTVYDIKVDGSVTPVEFDEAADVTDVKYIQRMIITGRGNGIKYGKFLSRSTLTNGLQVSFKTTDITVTREFMKTTDDLDDLHAGNPSRSKLSVQSGGDKYIAVLDYGNNPVELRPQGDFISDDFFRLTVNDDLTSGITNIRLIIEGYNREF